MYCRGERLYAVHTEKVISILHAYKRIQVLKVEVHFLRFDCSVGSTILRSYHGNQLTLSLILDR